MRVCKRASLPAVPGFEVKVAGFRRHAILEQTDFVDTFWDKMPALTATAGIVWLQERMVQGVGD